MKISHFIVLTFVVFGIYKTYEICKKNENENQNENYQLLRPYGHLPSSEERNLGGHENGLINENQNENRQTPTPLRGTPPSLGGESAVSSLKGESAPDNSAYIEVLDWTNDEYWEIQELNGKYYRVLDDGAFEEMGVYEEYEYEEEIGDIEDLYKYAQENKSRIVKAIKKP